MLTPPSSRVGRSPIQRRARNTVHHQPATQAIGELIALGEQEGFGITFNPDPAGSTVGYLRGMGGGEFLTGFDLGDTARAAMRPLLDLAARYAAARRERAH